MKIITVYKSKYGSSYQYAEWLAEALQCKKVPVENITLSELLAYDVIIYVGGIYAGSVSGFKQISKYLNALKGKKLLLCMVGMTNPAEHEKYETVYHRNVPEQYRSFVKPFSLRGDQLFSKMNGFHRFVMKIPKAAAEKVPVEQRTEDDRHFIENFGKDIHFAKQENIYSILEYINTLTV